MFCRNVDFFAAGLIVLILTAASHAPLLLQPEPVSPFRLRNAVTVGPIQLQDNLDSSLDCVRDALRSSLDDLLNR